MSCSSVLAISSCGPQIVVIGCVQRVLWVSPLGGVSCRDEHSRGFSILPALSGRSACRGGGERDWDCVRHLEWWWGPGEARGDRSHLFSILTQTYPPDQPPPPFAGDPATTDDDDNTTPGDLRVFSVGVGPNHEPLHLPKSRPHQATPQSETRLQLYSPPLSFSLRLRRLRLSLSLQSFSFHSPSFRQGRTAYPNPNL